jgi:hypothetical protein
MIGGLLCATVDAIGDARAMGARLTATRAARCHTMQVFRGCRRRATCAEQGQAAGLRPPRRRSVGGYSPRLCRRHGEDFLVPTRGSLANTVPSPGASKKYRNSRIASRSRVAPRLERLVFPTAEPACSALVQYPDASGRSSCSRGSEAAAQSVGHAAWQRLAAVVISGCP